MTSSPILVFHILAAIIGLLSGFSALFFRKGSRLHRISGNIFFISMLGMATSAAYLALEKSQMINAIVGALTFYLVTTAWLTVKRQRGGAGILTVGAMLFALAIGSSAIVFGWGAANGATGADKDGIPAAAYFVFGSVALLAAGLDVRLLIRGNVSGAQRIARHLWRMCFALLITTVSFFNGPRNRVLPGVIRETPIHDVPAIVVAVLLIFWLTRVLFTQAYKKPKIVGGDSSILLRSGPTLKG